MTRKRNQDGKGPRIPKLSLLETGLPVEDLFALARREGNAKKPIYEIHKWWARRLGHVFKVLLLAATIPAPRRSQRLPRALYRLLDRFYRHNQLRGILVLDPFMGGGTSVVESLKCGAHVIGVDVDPVAWFVTKKEIEPFDEGRFLTCYQMIAASLEPAIRSLYKTWDPKTHQEAEIVNAFWVTRISCPNCRRAFDAHPHYRLSIESKKQTQVVFCSECGNLRDIKSTQRSFKCKTCECRTRVDEGTIRNGKYSCPFCRTEGATRKLISPGEPLEKRLFALEYSRIGELDSRGRPVRRFKRATRGDVDQYRLAEAMLASELSDLQFPRAKIFHQNRYDLRPLSHGYEYYSQLFNARQLYCLAHIYEEILALSDEQAREYLLIAFSDSLASNNELVSYAFGYQKATPLFGIHGYQIPQRPVEGNVWGHPSFGRGSFRKCVGKTILGKRYALKPFEYRYSKFTGEPQQMFTGESIVTDVVSSTNNWGSTHASRACLLNTSSTSIGQISAGFVDIILTDPPFYDNLPYSELSDFYYHWLRPELTKYGLGNSDKAGCRDSLFVRRRTQAEHQKYLEGLAAVFRECARILKQNGLLIFTFHHRDPAAWLCLAVALSEAGFAVTSVSPVRAEGVSGFHSYGGTPKWDAVITCRHRDPRRSTTSVSWNVEAKIAEEESAWTNRLRKSGLPWSDADRTSLAFAITLRECVNTQTERDEAVAMYLRIAKRYPLKGIAACMPGQRLA